MVEVGLYKRQGRRGSEWFSRSPSNPPSDELKPKASSVETRTHWEVSQELMRPPALFICSINWNQFDLFHYWVTEWHFVQSVTALQRARRRISKCNRCPLTGQHWADTTSWRHTYNNTRNMAAHTIYIHTKAHGSSVKRPGAVWTLIWMYCLGL